ncbi:Cytoplasmic polyadenylation element-binding protein 2 [Goodea atripinnis]|uniref:Cytoplasmic polyadenylation element-binding protein 2 n=1 Tax=Goodea atripinnis TaxID=208336 RepID=A0ABV0MYE5_9TELE
MSVHPSLPFLKTIVSSLSGYAFLLFQEEASVQALIDACIEEDLKLYLCVSSPTIKDKPVQIRPWNLSDSDFVMDGSQPLDPRKTIFVGGVPRPLRAGCLPL